MDNIKCVIALSLLISGQSQADNIDYFSFALGMAIPIVVHEAGHQIAGGKDIEWRGAEWNCVRHCNASRISASGFVAEIAFAETISMAFDDRRHKSFLNGLNLSTGAHLLTYAFRNDDIRNFKSKDRKWIRPALALVGIFYLYKIEF